MSLVIYTGEVDVITKTVDNIGNTVKRGIMRILPASMSMASFTVLYNAYLGDLVSSQVQEWAMSQLVRVFIHEKHYT